MLSSSSLRRKSYFGVNGAEHRYRFVLIILSFAIYASPVECECKYAFFFIFAVPACPSNFRSKRRSYSDASLCTYIFVIQLELCIQQVCMHACVVPSVFNKITDENEGFYEWYICDKWCYIQGELGYFH